MSHQPVSFYRPSTARSRPKSTPLNSRARQQRRHALEPLDLNERAERGYQPGMFLQDQDPCGDEEEEFDNVGSTPTNSSISSIHNSTLCSINP